MPTPIDEFRAEVKLFWQAVIYLRRDELPNPVSGIEVAEYFDFPYPAMLMDIAGEDERRKDPDYVARMRRRNAAQFVSFMVGMGYRKVEPRKFRRKGGERVITPARYAPPEQYPHWVEWAARREQAGTTEGMGEEYLAYRKRDSERQRRRALAIRLGKELLALGWQREQIHTVLQALEKVMAQGGENGVRGA